MNLTKEIELLMFITSKHISVEQDDINVKSKYKEQVMARMVISNILMECGMKPAQLAKHFCKHRTNFYHYLKLHKQYIQNPRMYPEYIEAFNLVFAEYKTKSERIERINELQALDEVDRAIADLIQIRKALA
jgi:hypothetical protein